MKEPAYRAGYDTANRRIARVDTLVQALDERRERLGMKAELARRAELAPEAVCRLFSVDAPNPTVSTLIALTDALDLELLPRPRRASTPKRKRG